MSINRKNAEGYRDPTTYEALTNIAKDEADKAEEQREQEKKKYRPKVYVCSPFSGDVKTNTINARRYCAFAVKEGYIPFASHLFYPQFLSDEIKAERELGLFMGLVFLDGCKEVWVFGNRITNGMAVEIDRAKERKIVIRYFNDGCVEVQAWECQKS